MKNTHSRLWRLLTLMDEYNTLMCKVGYMNSDWDIYMTKHARIKVEIAATYKHINNE